MVPAAQSQGFYGRAQFHGQRHRRARPEFLRELRMRYRKGNYIKYCNPELDKLIDQQSMEPNQDKRKTLVWEIEKKLAEDGVRPIIFYAPAGNCRQPYVKGLTIMSNSIYNGWRM